MFISDLSIPKIAKTVSYVPLRYSPGRYDNYCINYKNFIKPPLTRMCKK